MRLPRWNITVARFVIPVVLAALVLSLIHYFARLPQYEELGRYNAMMTVFCESEAAIMTERHKACLARAANGDLWDDSSETAETLKCSPYPGDTPRYGSWLEQAAVWERAARIATRSAKRYARLRDWCTAWGLVQTQQDR
jgi:hypothetical protein